MQKLKLKEAWRRYVLDKIIPDDCIKANILESWRRCQNMGVDPWQKLPTRMLPSLEFASIVKKKQTLIDICVPYMKTLHAFVAGSGFVIVLTDENGIILKIIGDHDIATHIKNGGFHEGADWSEKSAGTNAVGTSLYTGTPLQIYSYEHFCRCAQVSTGSCAIIHSARQDILGTIGLVGYDYSVHSHTLGMAVAAADAISNSLIALSTQKKIERSDTYKSVIMNCISQAMLAVDSCGLITYINEATKNLLMLPLGADYVQKGLMEVLGPENDDLRDIIRSRREYTDKEIFILTKKGKFLYNITTRIVRTDEDGFDGIVLVFDSINRVRKIVHRMSGAVASKTFDDLSGRNPAYLKNVSKAKNAALTDSNVLLLGENGTGKSVFAQAIHNHSQRRNGPFVTINCSAIPQDLIGSELFGYVEGAYTGARKGGSPGKFELADGGTIFLDEIGDMPLAMQGNLLQVIEEKRFMRIGGHDMINADVRIIAATNKPITQNVENGNFRQDLFYRLNILTICMIPLRERMDDLDELIEYFYNQLSLRQGIFKHPIPPVFLEKLRAYSFPGNVRELQHMIEQCIALSENGSLNHDLLPEEVNAATAQQIPTIGKATKQIEKQMIYEMLTKNSGNISKTARELGVARTTLYRKLYYHNIHQIIAMQ